MIGALENKRASFIADMNAIKLTCIASFGSDLQGVHAQCGVTQHVA